MLTGKVVGPVWASKRLDGYPPSALLEIECHQSGARIVAVDVLGSGVGDLVLLTQGSTASNHFPGSPPVDALIVGLIDEPSPAVSDRPAGRSNSSKNTSNQGEKS